MDCIVRQHRSDTAACLLETSTSSSSEGPVAPPARCCHCCWVRSRSTSQLESCVISGCADCRATSCAAAVSRSDRARLARGRDPARGGPSGGDGDTRRRPSPARVPRRRAACVPESRSGHGGLVIIDSSKYATDCLLLSQPPGVRVHAIHLVRDSRAVAYSWQRRKPRPGSIGDGRTCRSSPPGAARSTGRR